MKRLEEVKELLIVVDMVNGFAKEGAMADPYIMNIVPEIKNLSQSFIEKDEGLFFIKDCHQEKCVEFNYFPAHCVKGTKESEIVDELKVYEVNASKIFEKNSTSTMFADGFMNTIDTMEKLERVIIVGCCTDICVLNLAIPLKNYFNQKDRMIEIEVPKNAVETYNSPAHNRDEYNEMSYKLLAQSGIIVK